jgi:hypothetical protein
MKKLILLLCGVSVSTKVLAQFPNVLISTSNSPEEVSIAINPKNTNQIVAGANINNSYRSNDAGVTWSVQTLVCNAYGVWGDPVLIWDTANTCYYLHLSNPPSGGSWIDRIVVQKSTNFGQNYTTCTYTGKNGTKAQDKEWAVVNPLNNEMHLTWTQFDVYGSTAPEDSSIILYSKSSDGGTNWSTPKRISHYAGDCVDSDNTVEGAVPAVGPLGELYVAWAGPKGLVFQKSLDGGTTWLATETIINSFPGGWDYAINGLKRCNGLPFTYCDLSNGPHKGTIYINWSDQSAGANDGDIWMIKSTDGGTTWSNPKRVNDDVPGKQQFMSNMTIDQVTGYVYVLFYDRRNFSSGTNTDVYMAFSQDGGATYTNYKVNAKAFTPSASYFFGDYIGISGHNNVIRPIWMQMTSTGSLTVYTAIIDPTIIGNYNANPANVSVITAMPNPFKAETSIDFYIAKKSELTIQLVDNTGKIISVIYNKKMLPEGTNTLTLNANQLNLVSGIYYVVFYDEEKSKYVKLIVE